MLIGPNLRMWELTVVKVFHGYVAFSTEVLVEGKYVSLVGSIRCDICVYSCQLPQRVLLGPVDFHSLPVEIVCVVPEMPSKQKLVLVPVLGQVAPVA